ncbi:MAG: hypothetical protein O3B41_06815 [Bacteroidetes bacterium]|nr:hypothetical protein [Bacteroidota bacterium]
MTARTVAKLAWSVPVFLLALTVHQAYTAVQLKKTMDQGTLTWAEVTRYERSDRKDVTEVELDLIVHLPDGSQFEREKLTLPYSIGHRVEADTLEVMVLQGAAQEIVIKDIGDTQVRIAWSNMAMSFIALVMAFSGVFAWNRMMRNPAVTPDSV